MATCHALSLLTRHKQSSVPHEIRRTCHRYTWLDPEAQEYCLDLFVQYSKCVLVRGACTNACGVASLKSMHSSRLLSCNRALNTFWLFSDASPVLSSGHRVRMSDVERTVREWPRVPWGRHAPKGLSAIHLLYAWNPPSTSRE